MFNLPNRGELDPSTEFALENTNSRLKSTWLTQHNEDGTHKFSLFALDASVIKFGTLADARLSANVPLLVAGKLPDADLSSNVAFLASANIFTQDQTVSKTRPEVKLLHSGTQYHRLQSYVTGNGIRSVNARFNGTGFDLDDTANPGTLELAITDATRAFEWYTFTAGTNPRTAVEIFKVLRSGALVERGRSASLGEWTAYTPVWTASVTNPTIGNGTITGRFSLVGNTCHFTIDIAAGSTTTFGSGIWAFSLPVTASVNAQFIIGNALMRPAATDFRLAAATLKTSTTTGLVQSTGVNFVASTDYAWTNGDTIRVHGRYEI